MKVYDGVKQTNTSLVLTDERQYLEIPTKL